MKFGDKVEAYPGSEDARVGFFLHAGGEGDDGKDAIQVGAEVHPLNQDEEAPEGNRGGTYRAV